MKKYAFLDRDGALIFEPQTDFQIDSLEKLQILPGVIEALKKILEQGYELIMVSNQNGLGTPSFPTENFEAPQDRMLEIFKENGISFSKIFVCPHFPVENCECRKPKLGLLKEFLEENEIDKGNSFMYGDRESDRQFANNLGIKFYKAETNSACSLTNFL